MTKDQLSTHKNHFQGSALGTFVGGAMAGALAGAYYGYSAIPSAWLESLENGEKGRDYVAALAAKLARIKAEEQ